MRLPNGLTIDNPAYPLLQAGIAYIGYTSANGNAAGTTLVCADLDNHPTYVGNRIKVLTGGAWGQDRGIENHAVGGILTVGDAFTDAAGAAQQIVANTLFVILSNSGAGGGGAPENYASGTQTAVITTEHFLSSPNEEGEYTLLVDTINMVAGDILELRVYKMVLTGGTARVAELLTFYGDQPADEIIKITTPIKNDLAEANAVRFSLTQTFGTGRDFPWKVLIS